MSVSVVPEDQPPEDQPNGDQPNGDQPNGDQPNGDQPNGDQPNGDQPNGDQPNGDQPTDPDDELLTAYLDGELPRQQRVALEGRLVSETSLQKRLGELQSSWDILESLPAVTSSSRLVESTLELAIADVSEFAPKKDGDSYVSKRAIWLAIVSVVAVAVGIGLAAYGSYQNYRAQLNDLAIAQRIDAYNRGGDLDLMRRLAENPQWLELVATSQQLTQTGNDEPTLVLVAGDQREATIENMSLESRQQLSTEFEFFQQMDPAYKRRLRETADTLSDQPDQEQLLQTMQAYASWRESLSDDLVDRIENLEGDELDAAIAEGIQQSRDAMARQSGGLLSEETTDSIYLALVELLPDRMRENPRMQSWRRETSRRFGVAEDSRRWAEIRHSFMPPDPNRKPPGGLFPRFEPLNGREREFVYLVLPDDAKDTLDTIAAGDGLMEATAMQIWVDEAIFRKSPNKREVSLVERYNRLEAVEKETLELLPPEELFERLGSQRSGR